LKQACDQRIVIGNAFSWANSTGPLAGDDVIVKRAGGDGPLLWAATGFGPDQAGAGGDSLDA
jgi:hypothetical protein